MSIIQRDMGMIFCRILVPGATISTHITFNFPSTVGDKQRDKKHGDQNKDYGYHYEWKENPLLYNNTCSFCIFIGRELCVIKVHTHG